MSDAGKLLNATSRALRAQQLMDDEFVTEAFKGLEDAYALYWRNTAIEDAAGREKMFLAINIVGKVRDHLGSIITNGKLAQAELNDLARVAERKKRFGFA